MEAWDQPPPPTPDPPPPPPDAPAPTGPHLVPEHDLSARGKTIQMKRLVPGPIEPPLQNVAVPPHEAIAWLCCDPFPPIPLGQATVLTIGRDPECGMILPHDAVSRVHAVVRCVGRDLVLEDRSTFGTWLNGKRIGQKTVVPGDNLRIGPYELAIRFAPGRPAEGSGEETRPLGQYESSAALQGRLEKVPLAEVLQHVEFNEKTGTLRVIADELEGRLAVHQGRPMWAEMGPARGVDAVIAMLAVKEGAFSFVSKVEPGERTIDLPFTAILLEASRRADEG